MKYHSADHTSHLESVQTKALVKPINHALLNCYTPIEDRRMMTRDSSMIQCPPDDLSPQSIQNLTHSA